MKTKQKKAVKANIKYPLDALLRARYLYLQGRRLADIARQVKVPVSVIQQAIKGRRRYGQNLPYRGLEPLP
jgi:hypothetical protein